MIGKGKRRLRRICRNYHLVENYEKAIADEEQLWELHHRREIDEMKSSQQLRDEGRYFDVEPSDLIFLTASEHRKLHNTGERHNMYGKHHSAETKKKISDANKSEHLSEETRKKMSDAKKGKESQFKGKHHSEEAKKKNSDAHKGKHWWNDGIIAKLSKECPGEGFVCGRLKFNK